MFHLSRKRETTAARPLAGTVIRIICDYRIDFTRHGPTMSNLAVLAYHLTPVQCNTIGG
jgi:hypothetical protein